ncbi:hypothetical protein [Bradyrhizobium sp. AZCC 2289]|uniref:hypothetical protein n=1 Tax=Bradyrhizobium sp. AZCC 2289 TaxID=3117026 RepID=UPI002FF3F724
MLAQEIFDKNMEEARGCTKAGACIFEQRHSLNILNALPEQMDGTAGREIVVSASLPFPMPALPCVDIVRRTEVVARGSHDERSR